jgi:glycogen synthase
MRLLILSNIFPPGFMGGYELGALEVAQELRKRGHDVEIATSDYFMDERGQLGAFKVHRILECTNPSRLAVPPEENVHRGAFINIRNLHLLASIIQDFMPEMALCFNLAGLGVFGIVHYLAAVGLSPVLYLMDNNFMGCADGERLDSFKRIVGDLSFLDKSHFVVMSSNLSDQVEASLHKKIMSKTIIPGWFDGAPGRSDFTVSPGGTMLRFLFASRICDHKGIRIILDAARLLLERQVLDFEIHLYGLGNVAETMHEIVANRLGRHVQYQGCADKAALGQLYAQYDALLFPTWEREPFGFVVSEASWGGCIPVMTAGIGAAEWFLDGVDCLKIRRDPMDLAGAMARLIAMPASERTLMRMRTHATAGRFFPFKQCVDKLEELLTMNKAHERPDEPYSPRRCELALTVLADMWDQVKHG